MLDTTRIPSGHNGNMPQILKLEEMPYYVLMRPDAIEKPAITLGKSWTGDYHPFEIKTPRIDRRSGAVKEVDALERCTWEESQASSAAPSIRCCSCSSVAPLVSG